MVTGREQKEKKLRVKSKIYSRLKKGGEGKKGVKSICCSRGKENELRE